MSSRRASGAELIPQVHAEAAIPSMVEQELHVLMEQIEEPTLHHSDRPEIEWRILAFVAQAAGPTVDGIASMMGVPPEAAAVHVQNLKDAGRLWGQPGIGGEIGWHVTLEGQRFVTERGAEPA